MAIMPRFTALSVLSADPLNTISEELEKQGRSCRVRRTSPLTTLSSSTETVVPWSLEDWDTNGGGMWDPGSPHFITVQDYGTYLILAQVRWDDPGTSNYYRTGMRYLSITVDGTNTSTSACRGDSSADATKSLTGRGMTTQAFAVERLEPGQRVYCVVSQDCGSTIVGCQRTRGGTYLSVTRATNIA